MTRMFSLRILLFTVLFVGLKSYALAQTDKLEGYWYNEEKSAKIHIYKAKDGHFYGKIAWLAIPLKDGKPKVDDKNPDKARQNDPLIGLLILQDFSADGDNSYSGGTIYDPKNGKTYSCKIKYSSTVLDVRGYVGISLIGRTTKWTKAEQP
jgi:uncharacterized protein (DUF2147 family)